jgi:acetyl-CoA decarbonylase/synthase complex subunit delta
VKEARALEKEEPDWGDRELRNAYWEIATAMSLLVAGSELLIMYHPKAVEVVRGKIAEMLESKKGK